MISEPTELWFKTVSLIKVDILKRGCPGWGANPGLLEIIYRYSNFHHFTAEPQRLPKEVDILLLRIELDCLNYCLCRGSSWWLTLLSFCSLAYDFWSRNRLAGSSLKAGTRRPGTRSGAYPTTLCTATTPT
jgi:hypothetical protein